MPKLTDLSVAHWRLFNFLARRVVALAFIAVGIIVAIGNLSSVLPGGSIQVDGSASSDIVFRIASVGLPLVVAGLGVLLYLSKPYFPSHDIERER